MNSRPPSSSGGGGGGDGGGGGGAGGPDDFGQLRPGLKALIDWIQLQEKLEKTDAQNRPTSLAWEVRKMSPGRHVMPIPPADRIVPSPNARRTLNFGWADRVKSTHSLACSGHPTIEKFGKKPVPEEPVSPGKAGDTEQGHGMEPPTESAPDLGLCVDVPREDVPPRPMSAPAPSQGPEARPPPTPTTSTTTSTTTLSLPASIPVPAAPASLSPGSPDLPPADTLSATLSLGRDSGGGDGGGTVGGASQDGVAVATSSAGAGRVEADITAAAPPKPESIQDPTELSTPQSMAEVLAKKEELADRLERANEEAIASAIAEEEQLTREIQAENNELETDNDSDFTMSNMARKE
ncbi:hypothetical protein CRUP_030503 [Coryphaenoides rupestris]|nr:hypothetical protein CRUP_030503 [Coryphaenoides rupestris]